MGVRSLATKRMVIQTRIPHDHIFAALIKNDPHIFYSAEPQTRKQLLFQTYSRLCLVKLRSRKPDKVQEASSSLFGKLKEVSKDKGLEVLSLNPGYPAKLRGNFYWQILIRSRNVLKLSKFLKN